MGRFVRRACSGSVLFLLFLLLILNVTCPCWVTSALAEWSSNGPDGGSISCLAIDPQNAQTIYAGTGHSGYGNGVFMSTNGGSTWNQVNSGLPVNSSVSFLAIDPEDSQTVYAGIGYCYGGYHEIAGYGLFKSTNGGASWSHLTSDVGVSDAFAIDPHNTQTIYAGTYSSGVIKSTNGGATWSGCNSAFPSVTLTYSLTIDPHDHQTIYAGTSSGLFKSMNGGKKWTRVTCLKTTNVYSVVVALQDPDIIYVGSFGGGVYKSANGGRKWKKVNSGLKEPYVLSLAIDPTDLATIYARTHDGTYKSTNGGITWVPINSGVPVTSYNRSLAIDPENPQTIYIGTDYLFPGTEGTGVYKSTNGGESWNFVNSGVTNAYVQSVAIDSQNSETIYAGTGGTGVCKSTDAGTTWLPINSGLTNRSVLSLAIDPQNSDIIFAGTWEGVYKSTNGGGSWSLAGLTYEHVYSLVIDPQNLQTIYAGTEDTGVYKSMNGGASWSLVSSGMVNAEVYSLAIDPQTPWVIYAGANTGVFKSADAGGNWTKVTSGIYDVYSVTIDPQNSQIIYAGAGDVFKSVDGGTNWSQVSSGIWWTRQVAIDPQNPQVIYVGSDGHGIFRSVDGGTNWSQVSSGMTDTFVLSLAIDPQNPETVYAGTRYGGVYKAEEDLSPLITLPGAPQSAYAKAGDAQATVSFYPPLSNGGSPITSYTVTSIPGGITAQGTGSPITVTGLTNGTSYLFAVKAANAVCAGFAGISEDRVTPKSAPTISVISPNGGELWERGRQYTISWTYTGNPGKSVMIELLNGSSSSVIKSGTTIGANGEGSWTWTIPKKRQTGDDYRIRITSKRLSSCTGASKTSFSIR